MLPRLSQVYLLLMQFYGIIFVYIFLISVYNDMILAYFMAKTTIARRRERYSRIRKLRRQNRSTWVKNGRTEAWWINMISGITPADEWKRNFRMANFKIFVKNYDPIFRPDILPIIMHYQ